MVDFLTEFCLFSPKSLILPATLIIFWSFPGKKPDFCETFDLLRSFELKIQVLFSKILIF